MDFVATKYSNARFIGKSGLVTALHEVIGYSSGVNGKKIKLS